MTSPRIAAAIPAIALATALLSGCAPGTPGAGPVTPTVTSAPTVAPTPTPAPEPVPADLRANIIDAMSSGNTAALEGYLAPTVHFTYAASEAEGDITDRARIIDNLTNATLPTATWDFDLPASVLDDYANNPGHYPSYADDFIPGAIVGRSSENKVISFIVEGDLITRIFVADDEYALTFEE